MIIDRSARGAQTEEEKLICELVIAWTQKRWVNITSLLTARLLQYQEVLIFGGYLKGQERATRKLDEETFSAHRQFLKEGLNKRLKLDDKKVREIQRLVGAPETGRYGLETVSEVTAYQKILKEKADYKGNIDGFWGKGTEEAHKLLEKEMSAEMVRIRLATDEDLKARKEKLLQQKDAAEELKQIEEKIQYRQFAEKKPENWSREDIKAFIRIEAQRVGIDPSLALALSEWESKGFNPKEVSGKGAKGLYQLMPITIKDIEQRWGIKVEDPFNPYQNIRGGLRYLKWLSDRYDGDELKTLAAWNWGFTKVLVDKPLPPLSQLPAQTKDLIENMLGLRGKYHQGK